MNRSKTNFLKHENTFLTFPLKLVTIRLRSLKKTNNNNKNQDTGTYIFTNTINISDVNDLKQTDLT